MPFNYKYADPGRRVRRRGKRAKIILAVLAALFVVIVTYGFYFITTRNSGEQILTGQYDRAIESLDHWTWLPLASSRVHEELGTAELLKRGNAAAESHFRKAENGLLFRPIDSWREVLKILWSQSRYADGRLYADHIAQETGEDRAVHFYRAGFLAGQNKLEDALKAISAAGNLPEFSKEIEQLKSEIEQRSASGRYTFIYDREGYSLVNMTLDGRHDIVQQSLQPLLVNKNGDYLSRLKKDLPTQIVFSIDNRFQTAAMRALDPHFGAIVVMDPRSGDILALASRAREGTPANESPALNKLYEPGSIIKMITLAGSLEKNLPLNQTFPLQCTGTLPVRNNRVFYDWIPHNDLPDVNKATAVSCNIAFAKLGLLMQPGDLLNNLRNFGFDTKLSETFIPIDLGTLRQGDGSDIYISNLSIGLDYMQMTPLHAAIVASAIANGGVAMLPRVMLGHRNIIGIPSAIPRPVEFKRMMSQSTARTLTRAMEAVITDAEGTGRRAAIPNFPFAIKTGTAGEGAKGYDAVIIGFAPSNNPRIAFSIFLENAGKAEFAGAHVTRLLLEAVRGYI